MVGTRSYGRRDWIETVTRGIDSRSDGNWVVVVSSGLLDRFIRY